MIKLVTIDLDGTLLDPNGQITAPVIDAVAAAKEKGVKIVITTGRPLMGVTHILDTLHLREPGDYVITYNGALIQRADTGDEIIKETICRDDFLDIDAVARKIGLHLMAITRDGIYTSQRDIGKYVVREAAMVNMPLYYRLPEEIGALEIAKIMAVDEPDILDNGISYMPFEFFERFTMVKSTPYYLEFVNRNASKGNAITALAKKLYLDMDEVMAIGDEENDRTMLEAAGFPVVMSNGKESLKKIAKEITKSNAESGVAHAINQWVLQDYQ